MSWHQQLNEYMYLWFLDEHENTMITARAHNVHACKIMTGCDVRYFLYLYLLFCCQIRT